MTPLLVTSPLTNHLIPMISICHLPCDSGSRIRFLIITIGLSKWYQLTTQRLFTKSSYLHKFKLFWQFPKLISHISRWNIKTGTKSVAREHFNKCHVLLILWLNQPTRKLHSSSQTQSLPTDNSVSSPHTVTTYPSIQRQSFNSTTELYSCAQ